MGARRCKRRRPRRMQRRQCLQHAGQTWPCSRSWWKDLRQSLLSLLVWSSRPLQRRRRCELMRASSAMLTALAVWWKFHAFFPSVLLALAECIVPVGHRVVVVHVCCWPVHGHLHARIDSGLRGACVIVRRCKVAVRATDHFGNQRSECLSLKPQPQEAQG